MDKLLRRLILSVVILLLGYGTEMLYAQVTFTLTDTAKYTQNGLRYQPGNTGAAWGDYDGDGDLDLWMGGGGTPSGLFRNDWNTSSTFTKVSRSIAGDQGIMYDSVGYTLGGVWADFNGDGRLDLVHVNGGLALWLNNGVDFVYSSVAAGLNTQIYGGSANLWSIAVGDYDQDGDLDIAMAGGDNSRQNTVIFNNTGGVFTDVAGDVIGFDLSLESWNPQWVDMDGDGDLDLWMPTIRTKNTEPNEPCAFLMNDGGGGLIYADSVNTHVKVWSAIASSWADFDNDGDMDLLVIPHNDATASGGTPMLLRNDGVVEGYPTFTDVIAGTALDSTAAEYSDVRSVDWGDFDNDGDQDLLINRRNGKVQTLFRNDGDNVWTEVANQVGAGIVSQDFRTGCFVDYDMDGWLDLFYMGSGQAADTVNKKWLLHNEGNANHWIGIKPKGIDNNISAIGARVRVVAGDLGQIQDIQAGGGGGLLNGKLWARFGLGSATVADSVIVTWPDGSPAGVALQVNADQYYTFVQGVGITGIAGGTAPQKPAGFSLGQNYPNPFNPSTTIEFSLPVRSNVRLIVSNILGEVVKVLAKGSYAAGYHTVRFDGANLAAGVYFYRLQADDFVQVRKLVLLK
jgi:hypothetical protein